VNDAGWCDPFTMQCYLPAKTRITNKTQEPLEYFARGPHTVWGGPYKLQPGRSDDFSAPYPVTIRQKIGGSENVQTPTMGTRFLLGGTPKASQSASSAGAEPTERRD
jgi:hypothetical protein